MNIPLIFLFVMSFSFGAETEDLAAQENKHKCLRIKTYEPIKGDLDGSGSVATGAWCRFIKSDEIAIIFSGIKKCPDILKVRNAGRLEIVPGSAPNQGHSEPLPLNFFRDANNLKIKGPKKENTFHNVILNEIKEGSLQSFYYCYKGKWWVGDGD